MNYGADKWVTLMHLQWNDSSGYNYHLHSQRRPLLYVYMFTYYYPVLVLSPDRHCVTTWSWNRNSFVEADYVVHQSRSPVHAAMAVT